MWFENLKFSSEWWMLLLPCIFMALDILTGMLKGLSNHEGDSSIMRQGLIHKACEIIIIVAFKLLEQGLGLPAYIVSFACLYIIFMEIYSMLENLDACGVKVPSFLKKTMMHTADQLDKGEMPDISDTSPSTSTDAPVDERRK